MVLAMSEPRTAEGRALHDTFHKSACVPVTCDGLSRIRSIEAAAYSQALDALETALETLPRWSVPNLALNELVRYRAVLAAIEDLRKGKETG